MQTTRDILSEYEKLRSQYNFLLAFAMLQNKKNLFGLRVLAQPSSRKQTKK